MPLKPEVSENTMNCLNESPSKKEGKFEAQPDCFLPSIEASMKAPPRRKGNVLPMRPLECERLASMKAPPRRKGNAVQRKL